MLAAQQRRSSSLAAAALHKPRSSPAAQQHTMAPMRRTLLQRLFVHLLPLPLPVLMPALMQGVSPLLLALQLLPAAMQG